MHYGRRGMPKSIVSIPSSEVYNALQQGVALRPVLLGVVLPLFVSPLLGFLAGASLAV